MSLSNSDESTVSDLQLKNAKTEKGRNFKNKACNDFLNAICYNNPCCFSHIVSSEAVIFCHDYQNSGCFRQKCRFLHYSIEEEGFFRKFGRFPESMENNISPPVTSPSPPPAQQRMNYSNHVHGPHSWHNTGLSTHERPTPYPQSPPLNRYRDRDSRLVVSDREFRDIKLQSPPNDRYETSIRRIRDDLDIISIIRRFEEEQIMLRRRVEANEIKIAELRASNEYLMAQNAQYRMNAASVQCSRVVNPVTVTNTSTPVQPQGPQQQSIAVSLAPVQVQATPIVSIAGPQTQIIASNCTPLAIASTSQGQQLALAAQQSLSSSQALGPPPQILSTASLTLAPTLASAPSMGLALNPTSQAIAMSNATQPIISYPVMTHSILPH